MPPRFQNIPILILVLFFSTGTVFAQSGDGLDFLDKVENIQIPKETEEPKPVTTKTTTTKPTTSKNTTNTTKSAPTQPATKKTVTKPAPVSKPTVTKTTVTKTTPSPTKTVTKQQPTPPTTTSTTTTSLTTRVAPEKEEVVSPEKASQIWIDVPLEMEPDYLPGFSKLKTDVVDNKPEGETKKDPLPEKEFSRPLPALDGNFSIWGSLVEFLSKYQKAFYIFGILLLFAIYRLKSGRNSSSSRKSTPTIRRMRR